MVQHSTYTLRDRLKSLVAMFTGTAFIVTQTIAPAYALPQGGQVNGGSATISSGANQVDINQSSQRALIDWNSFNISNGETVNFNQPNSGAVSLNRIHDANPSQIDGALNANGQVWLVNSQGIAFGADAQVNVGGLLATSSDTTNSSFMSGGNTFNIPGNPNAYIKNAGRIHISDGGVAALVGTHVVNSGVIEANLGTVQLASGDELALDLNGDGLISIAASDAVLDQLVDNSGSIVVKGGRVLLSLATASNAVNSLINMPGTIDASNIVLDSGDNGTTLVSGAINARGDAPGQAGGNVDVLGKNVGILSGAAIDTSGKAGGGTIRVGGDVQGTGTTRKAKRTIVQNGAKLISNATDKGNGGKVIVWSDDRTDFAGYIEAKGGINGGNGGFVETSGKNILSSTGNVDASAPFGNPGLWLLDPNNVIIQAAGSDTNVSGNPNFNTTDDTAIITTGSIQTALNAGTSVSVTTSNGGTNSQAGDITVASNITKSAGTDASLTLSANNNIIVNGGVSISSSSGQLNVIFGADSDASGAGGIVMNSGSSITTNGGGITFGGGATPATGYAYGTSATSDNGIMLNGTTLTSGGGTIIMHGSGNLSGGSAFVVGVYVTGGTQINSGAGNITFSGQGGGASSTLNAGIYEDNGAIQSTSGDITLTGTSSTSATNVQGVAVGSSVSTTGGNITVTGTAASGTSASLGVNAYGTLSTTGSGNITITGTGGASAGLVASGIDLGAGGSMTTVNGDISLTGTDTGGGSAYGIDNFSGGTETIASTNGTVTLDGVGSASGIYIRNGTTLNLGNGGTAGAINVIADTINDAGTFTSNTSGTVTLKQHTAGTSIGINGVAGTLGITGNILTGISAGNLVIGRSDSSGLMRVNGGNLSGRNYNLSLLNGSGNIQFEMGGSTLSLGNNKNFSATSSTGSITSASTSNITTAGTGTISLNAGNAINLSNSFGLTSGSGAIDLTGSSGIAFGGVSTLTSSSGNITLNNAASNSAALTINNGTGTFNTASTLAANAALSITADDVALGGNITGTGAVTLAPFTNNRAFNVNNGVGGLNLSTAEIGYLNAGAHALTLGSAANTGTLTIGASTWSNALTLASGSGNIVIGGATNANGGLLVNGGTGTFTTTDTLSTGSGALTVNVDNIALGANVSGTGAVTLNPYTAGTAINVNNGAAGFNLSAAEANFFQPGFSGITIGSSSNTGIITLGAASWNDALNIVDGSGGITISGTQTMGANTFTASTNSNVITANAGITTTNKDITTTGITIVNSALDAGTGNITINDNFNNVTSGGVFINNGGSLNGYDVTIHSNSPAGYGAQVRINSGSSITGSHSVTLQDDSNRMDLLGSQGYAGVILNTGATITTPTLNVVTGGAAIDYYAPTLNVSGMTTLNGALDFKSNYTLPTSNITLSGPRFTLDNGVTFDTQNQNFTTTGLITIAGTLNAGTGNITLNDNYNNNTSGGILLNNGANLIGYDVTLHSFSPAGYGAQIQLNSGAQINGSNSVVIQDDSNRADLAASQGYNGIVLNTGGTVNTADLTIQTSGAPIDFSGATLNVTNNTAINGSLEFNHNFILPLSGTTLNGSKLTIAPGVTVSTQGQDFLFNGIITISGILDATGGNVTFTDNIQNNTSGGITIANGGSVLGNNIIMHSTRGDYGAPIRLNAGSNITATGGLTLTEDSTRYQDDGYDGIAVSGTATITTPSLTVSTSGSPIDYALTASNLPTSKYISFSGNTLGTFSIASGVTLDTGGLDFNFNGISTINGTINAGAGNINLTDGTYNANSGGIIVNNGGSLIGNTVTLHSTIPTYGAQIQLNSGSTITANSVVLREDATRTNDDAYNGIIVNGAANINTNSLSVTTAGAPIEYDVTATNMPTSNNITFAGNSFGHFTIGSGLTLNTGGANFNFGGWAIINGIINAGAGNITITDGMNRDTSGGIVVNSGGGLIGNNITLHSNPANQYGAQIRLNSGSTVTAAGNLTLQDDSTRADLYSQGYDGVVVSGSANVSAATMSIATSGGEIDYDVTATNLPTSGYINFSGNTAGGYFSLANGVTYDTHGGNFSFYGFSTIINGTMQTGGGNINLTGITTINGTVNAGTGDVNITDSLNNLANGGIVVNNGGSIIGHDLTLFSNPSTQYGAQIRINSGATLTASHYITLWDATTRNDLYNQGYNGVVVSGTANISTPDMAVATGGGEIDYDVTATNLPVSKFISFGGNTGGGRFSIASGVTFDTNGLNFNFNASTTTIDGTLQTGGGNIGLNGTTNINGTVNAGTGDVTITDTQYNNTAGSILINNGGSVSGHDITMHTSNTPQQLGTQIRLNSGSTVTASHTLTLQDDTTWPVTLHIGQGYTGIAINAGSTVTAPNLNLITVTAPIDISSNSVSVSTSGLIQSRAGEITVNAPVSIPSLTIMTDSAPILNSTVTSNSVVFKPYTASTSIGVAGGAGSLNLSSTMLDNITTGSFTFGDSTDTGLLTVNARNWNVPITLYGGSGGIAINGAQTMNGNTFLARTYSTGDITIGASGSVTSTAAGTPITLVSNHNFINNAGAAALVAGSGRWLVYSTNPANDTIGGLAKNFRRFNCTYGVSCPAIPGTGNGLLYSYSPTLTIAPVAASTDYGSAAPSFTYNLNGYLDTDATDDILSGAASLTTNYVTGNNAGSYNIIGAVNTLASSLGYTVVGSTLSGGLTVLPVLINVTANSGQTKVYGAANPTYTYGYSGLVNGDTSSVFTGAQSRAVGENVGSYAIGQGTLSAGINYTINYTGDNFAITPATLTVTATAAQSKIYGAANPTYTYGYSGLANGDTSSVFTGAQVRVAGENVGSYAISQGTLSAGSNYTINYTGNNFAINPATLTVTVDAGQNKTYGQANPGSYTYGYSGLTNGDTSAVITGSLARVAGENAGAYAINQNTLSAGSNYTISYTSNNFTINKAALTVTADAGQNKTYGQANPGSYTYGYSGLVNGDTSAVFTGAQSRAAGENAGSYAIGQGTLSAGGNYAISYTGDNFTINKAALTITADAGQTKVYGAANPTYTYGYSGLTNGDTSSVFTGAQVRVAGENVGSYAISQGTLSAGGNYNISYTGNNFAITPAALLITANDKSKTYGAALPTFDATYTGLANGDTSSVVSGLNLNTAATASSNVGTYGITASGASASNYTISYASGTLTINPATLTVTADTGQTKIYGSANPTYTYGYSGLTNGDTSAVFTGAQTRAAGENVGNYAISQGTLSAGSNYIISYTSHNFSITPATLTITTDAGQNKTYGDANPASYTYGFGGLVNGDTSSVFTGALARAAGENAGTYAINQGTLSAGGNYNITYTGSNFTINKAALTVTANGGQNKTYGQADPTFTYAYSGLVNGDTSSVFSGAQARAAGQNVGTYAINQGTLTAGGNYTITYTGANFAINKATLTVTANNGQGKTYGAANPGSYTYNYSGLTNGDSSAVFTGSLARGAGENVGSYAIGQGTLAAGGNYNIAYTGDSFAISKATVTVIANPQAKPETYVDPTFTYTTSGLVNGDNNSVFTGALSRVAGEAIGAYSITLGTLSAGGNYNINYSPALLIIGDYVPPIPDIPGAVTGVIHENIPMFMYLKNDDSGTDGNPTFNGKNPPIPLEFIWNTAATISEDVNVSQ